MLEVRILLEKVVEGVVEEVFDCRLIEGETKNEGHFQ
jgi:hypothetical protein